MLENHGFIEYLLSSEGLTGREGLTAQQIKRFTDEMPGGFFIYRNDNGQVIYANEALFQTFGCETMEEFRDLTGGTFPGMVHPEDLEAVENSITEQIVASRYDLDYVEYRIIRRDGEICWVEDFGHYIETDHLGGVFYVFLADVTDQRRRRMAEHTAILEEKLEKEQELQEQAELNAQFLDQMNDELVRRLELIEGLSADYEIVFHADLVADVIQPYRVSSRECFQFGRDLQVRPFRGFADAYAQKWVHPEDREGFLAGLDPEQIRETLADAKSFHINYRVLRNGEPEYVQALISNVSPHCGVTQIMFGCRTVDEEVRREKERAQMLEDALRQAKLAGKARNTFLSNMSHDMRTPMNAIFGFAALARKNLRDPEAAREYIGRMESSARQLMGMIERVLEVSAAVTGDSHTQEEACDLCGIVQEACGFIAPQAAEKDIDFILDCSGVRHSGIYGDEEKLRQLVTYLTNNAVTYTKPGGKVRVTLTEQELMPGQYAVYQLEVADTGIGISREFLARIFEPFSRERDTTHSGVHGIGLGMSIAKSIVERMGGTISVRSEVERGSVFTAVLDFRIQPDATHSAAEEAAVRPRSILLVEDNEINREIATELLQELGYVIDTAPDGSVAVEKMRQARPGDYDAILMDIQMPVMNGWEAARAIRGLPDPALAKIPIIALSANVFETDLRRSAESGMNAHLAKPMDVAEVQKTIEEFL